MNLSPQKHNPTAEDSATDPLAAAYPAWLLRLWRATLYSKDGLMAAWQYEAAFRLEVYCAIVMIPLALWLGQNGLERALLIGSFFCIIVAELINSAIEAICDLVSPDYHPNIKLAKDFGSAAVGVATLICILTWVFLLWPF